MDRATLEVHKQRLLAELKRTEQAHLRLQGAILAVDELLKLAEPPDDEPNAAGDGATCLPLPEQQS